MPRVSRLGAQLYVWFCISGYKEPHSPVSRATTNTNPTSNFPRQLLSIFLWQYKVGTNSQKAFFNITHQCSQSTEHLISIFREQETFRESEDEESANECQKRMQIEQVGMKSYLTIRLIDEWTMNGTLIDRTEVIQETRMMRIVHKCEWQWAPRKRMIEGGDRRMSERGLDLTGSFLTEEMMNTNTPLEPYPKIPLTTTQLLCTGWNQECVLWFQMKSEKQTRKNRVRWEKTRGPFDRLQCRGRGVDSSSVKTWRR